MKKTIVISVGDPCGCGPVITVNSLLDFKKKAKIFVTGSLTQLETIKGFKKISSKIEVIDVKAVELKKERSGFVSKNSGLAAISYLEKALSVVKNTKGSLVTGPVSKEAIQREIPSFKGHTEFLAAYFKVENPVMIMVSKLMKVVVLTRHIALKEVSSSLDKKMIKKTIDTTYSFLKKNFRISSPKIVILSVNPHAGVDTYLSEEEKTILSSIKKLKFKVFGPYPSDSIFIEDKIKTYDCIVASFHDQAMIPFKMSSFNFGVNVTAGLPIVRTSPSHGVALDAIRNGKKILSGSMSEAVNLAFKLQS